ncbi:DUF350 domain-containing protein [Bacillus ginsengihumi]|jgi:putative membrane protein|uniref:DUF350 domain-containing protein n=1 Tax=Heyndrickxia ginsengihumi TaxID=363870 RepID=A0A0A6VFC0_9BACI|nr:DUF350 domain-containing protein [Heyndrickxia ginsengihumi]KHD86950.1 membrane protein [Heyndrickxia ginsengihumi]MCM3021968.1 DUF350 domain-containing protein [Heyndrickxia ginsengihumi]NEY20883.1 DUF350 domain-containing protein [Heyndrickxia ginsengihumi]
MKAFWENEFIHTAGYYSVVILCMVVFLTIFEVATKYRNWEEIKKGNVAVAMATGGKIFGAINVFKYCIIAHLSPVHMIEWSVFGFGLLLLSYVMFEFLTPQFHVDEEIAKDNRAVGFIAMVISIALSFIIGAGIESFASVK